MRTVGPEIDRQGLDDTVLGLANKARVQGVVDVEEERRDDGTDVIDVRANLKDCALCPV